MSIKTYFHWTGLHTSFTFFTGRRWEFFFQEKKWKEKEVTKLHNLVIQSPTQSLHFLINSQFPLHIHIYIVPAENSINNKKYIHTQKSILCTVHRNIPAIYKDKVSPSDEKLALLLAETKIICEPTAQIYLYIYLHYYCNYYDKKYHHNLTSHANESVCMKIKINCS